MSHGLPTTIDLGGRTYRVLRDAGTGLVLLAHDGVVWLLPLGEGAGLLTLEPARLRRLG